MIKNSSLPIGREEFIFIYQYGFLQNHFAAFIDRTSMHPEENGAVVDRFAKQSSEYDAAVADSFAKQSSERFKGSWV